VALCAPGVVWFCNSFTPWFDNGPYSPLCATSVEAVSRALWCHTPV
jgi:hypothetical protein